MKYLGEDVVHKIQGYFQLLRPFTLLAPLIVSSCVIVASLLSSETVDYSLTSLLVTVLSASVCFALLNGASNVLNQVTDWKEDALSKPYRPIPKGIITHKEAYVVSFFLYFVAVLLASTVHGLFCFFASLIAFFSITYSLAPRMKKFLFFNQLWVALPRGFFGVIGSWSVFGNPFEPLPLVMGCIAAVFLFGGTATKDIRDEIADRAVGTKTVVNVYGLKNAAWFSLFFMVTAFLSIIPLVYLRIIDAAFLPLGSLCFLSLVIGWLMVKDHKNKNCENTSAWTLMYATYFIFAISFAMITISVSA
jgi:geranylgeranylglycerol-phosphate geranylgeranyltransferase